METTAESPRRRSSASSSPEFEFWMLRNPPSSNPQLPLLSADELFSDGILLPLHILSLSPTPIPPPSLPPPPPLPPPPSKKWKHIFKPAEKKPSDIKKDRKPSSSTVAPAATAAEINIHIWPFSRSRSSGNSRPRVSPAAVAARKTSSAPCSRCNSHGESSKHSAAVSQPAAAAVRKWTPSAARAGGIYLGRSNPVWQLRRRAVGGGSKKDNGGAGVGRVLNLNVNTCIGHQRAASCRDCEKEAEGISDDDRSRGRGGADADTDGRPDGEVNGGIFKLKAIFARKVY